MKKNFKILFYPSLRFKKCVKFGEIKQLIFMMFLRFLIFHFFKKICYEVGFLKPQN